jgi:hypothetical protein
MTSEATAEIWFAKAELAELLAILSSAVDRGDQERIITCYSPDSYDDHGGYKGSGRGFAEMVSGPSGPGSFMTIHHMLGQSVFDVDGDQAWGETFFVMHAVIGDETTRGFGRYIDYFQRIDGSWKIAYRRVVPDATIPGDDASSYWTPTRDRNDPRYDRLTAPPAGR